MAETKLTILAFFVWGCGQIKIKRIEIIQHFDTQITFSIVAFVTIKIGFKLYNID